LVHLPLPDDLAVEEWEAIGRDLAKAERAIQWLIGDWWRFGKRRYGEAEKIAAKLFPKMTYGRLRKTASVADRFKDLCRRRHKLSFYHHEEVAVFPAATADQFLVDAEDNKWSVRDLRAAVFRAKSQAKRKPIEDGCTVDDLYALIASGKRFSVIYCDPAWTFEVFGALGKDRSAEKHYETLTLDEIKALPVGDLAAEDCVLLMWAIMPELPGALDVIKAWGFNYKTVGFTWAKQNPGGDGWFMGLGYWTRANVEPCLLATRGTPQRIERDVAQLIVSPVSRHSEKPAEIYERIERLVDGPYIELFARERRPTWWAWGNEISRNQMAAE
jgi:N6-adenosine-specific RNA methylase IME4